MPKKIDLPELVKANKDIVFDLLSGVGVESFVVNFEGSGDSGQVDEPDEFKPSKSEKKAEKLVNEVVSGARISNGIRWSSAGQEHIWKDNPTLREVIDSVCYDTLEMLHGGWEINEGSYGTFTFDVKKRKVDFDFNERIVQTESHNYTL